MSESNILDCPVCGWPEALDQKPTSGDFSRVNCPRCGIFDITRTLQSTIQRYEGELHVLSGYLREVNEAGVNPKIGTADIAKIESIARKPKRIFDQIDKLMLYLGNHTTYFGKSVEINSHRELSVIFGKSVDELAWILSYLEESNLIKMGGTKSVAYKQINNQMSNSAVYPVHLTVKGMKYCEDIDKERINSNQAFVAMSFDPVLLEGAYNKAIKPAIEECGYDAICMADLEHTDDINDRIIAEIRKSKFMIADFTQQKGGVYFEAGFARGREIPVIWCCYKCDKEKLHFDTEHFCYIFWSDPKELREKLKVRIEAKIGLSDQERSR